MISLHALSDSRDVWLSLVFDSEQTRQLGHLPQQVNPNLSEPVDVNSNLNQPMTAYSLEHDWFKDGHVTTVGQ